MTGADILILSLTAVSRIDRKGDMRAIAVEGQLL